ncbi:MAG TPA: hypothetical protein VM286_01895 [Candidatus Thermoplasmatota archaeon]|nr:hypothetical protein [Candidatus Thermoplasmatota archaeon]
MRALVGVAVALLLSGCLTGGSDRYFPPASDLPDGLVPIAEDSPEWKLVAPFLGMQSNPGHLGVLDSLPRHELGEIASVDAYLLQDAEKESYGVMVLHFNETADIGAYLEQGSSQVCDNDDMAHVLRDGLVYILVGGDGSTEHGKLVLDHLAGAVQARSGADVIC